jgi:hypothetical protein
MWLRVNEATPAGTATVATNNNGSPTIAGAAAPSGAGTHPEPHTLRFLRAETGLIRKDTYMGRDMIVVPMVALRSGVFQSANSDAPELALAEEFGKRAEAWNGRAITMDHPRADGAFVPAGQSPQVMQDYNIGTVFNAKIEDEKLIVEAWIDVERAKGLNDNAKALLDRLNESSTKVEVSTGYFSDLEPTDGTFRGNSYKRVQRNVIPDHIAMLPEGVNGACSNADGCGAPRNNSAAPCACGGSCDKCKTPAPELHPVSNSTPKGFLQWLRATLGANASELSDENRREALQAALQASGVTGFVEAVWSDHFVYYDYMNGEYLSKKYSLGRANAVELSEGSKQVRREINYVPVKTTVNSEGQDPMTTNSGGNGGGGAQPNQNTPTESTPPVTPGNPAVPGNPSTAIPASTPNPQQQPGTGPGEQPTVDPATGQPRTAADLTAQQGRVQTVDQYLASAPPEIRRVLEGALSAEKTQRENLVKAIKANSANVFTDEDLAAMNVNQLGKLAALAGASTQVLNSAPTSFALNAGIPTVNSGDEAPPEPLRLFSYGKDGKVEKPAAANVSAAA